MKKLLSVLALLVMFLAPNARADGPDEQYVTIYAIIQQGDAFNEKGQSAAAMARYAEAQNALKRFKTGYPDWNVKVVKYRLKYLEEKISQLSTEAKSIPPAPSVPAVVPTNPLPTESVTAPAPEPAAPANTPAPIPAPEPAVSASAPTPAAPAPAPVEAPAETAKPAPVLASDADSQMKSLKDQINNLETDKALLEAKLKEALAAQPAAADPHELAKAQEQIKSLQKDNELLTASLAQARTNVPPEVAANTEKLQQELADSNRQVAQLTAATAALAAEKEAVAVRLRTLGAADATAASLSDENTRLKSQIAAAQSSLDSQKDTLDKREKALAASDATVAALRDENAVLKKQAAELQGKAEVASQVEDMSRKLKESQAQLAALQSDKELLLREKSVLEERVKQMPATPASVAVTTPAEVPPPIVVSANPTNQPASVPPVMDSVTTSQIAQLETQRDELQKSLNAATKDIYGGKKGKETAERMDEMSRQTGALRARLEIFEAQPIPYTGEELALLSKPDNTLDVSVHARKPAPELPANAQVLLSEAQRYFVAHDLEKAEAKYLEVLKFDDKNVVTLADLASIQLELGKWAEAEKYLKTAIAVDPNDDYSLFVLGQLKFQQKRYDEALDALSRAAQINPQNAKIQNFLGLTLSEKGLRGPAETAFRKAVQFDPNFAEAHMNLAVVYITQEPPLAELARWHYQKAMAAGHPANPNLEALLDSARTVSAAGH